MPGTASLTCQNSACTDVAAAQRLIITGGEVECTALSDLAEGEPIQVVFRFDHDAHGVCLSVGYQHSQRTQGRRLCKTNSSDRNELVTW